MRTPGNSSSSPGAEPRLLDVSLARLRPHPANANVMGVAVRATLLRNIARQGACPPLVVRPHPEEADAYQILDGHQRAQVVEELGWRSAPCYVWPCDDETALLLLATLNRLHGDDLPVKRAALLHELQTLLPVEELARLLPEDGHAIEQTLQLLQLDADAIAAELAAAAETAAQRGPRLVSFAVDPDDEPGIEAAIARASEALAGRNKRGRALAAICRAWTDGADA